VADQDTGTVYPTIPLTDPATAFYWLDGSFGGTSRVVQHAAVAQGVNLTAEATFSVKRPEATMTTQTDSVRVDGGFGQYVYGLRFGDTSGPGTPGIAFHSAIQVPSGFSGDASFVQIYSMFRRLRLSSLLHLWQRAEGVGLDRTFPYSDHDSYTEDMPAQQLLEDVDMVELSDSASMYYMFRPAGADDQTIWVPLRVVGWSWGGTAHMDSASGVWVLDSANNSQNPGSVDTITPPTWTGNISDLEWEWEAF
jgi:hypothetical protein